MHFKTSTTHPLQIAVIAAPRGGQIGVTFCPGKHQTAAMSGAWRRDLTADMRAIQDWGAFLVITLLEAHEFETLAVPDLGRACTAAGLAWLHLPIRDYHAPDAAFETCWVQVRADLHTRLDAHQNLLVHCKGGLGRAGTIAARLLIERGLSANEAMETVRRQRPGAVETGVQEDYLHALATRSPTS